MAAIRDPGAAVTQRSRRTKRSVITDLGQEEYAKQLRAAGSSISVSEWSPGPLNDKLYRALEGTELHQKFCPNSELLQIITPTSVKLELERQERLRDRIQIWNSDRRATRIDALAREICGEPPGDTHVEQVESLPPPSFRAVFAILIMVERPWKIKRFIKAHVSDLKLPLDGRQTARQFRLYPRRSSNMNELEAQASKKRPAMRQLICFRGWRSDRRRHFEEKQWIFKAPFFTRDLGSAKPVKHYKLHEKAILPFLSWKEIGHGAFGQVFRVEIHNSHHRFQTTDVSVRAKNLPACSKYPLESDNLSGAKQLLWYKETIFKRSQVIPSRGYDVEVVKRH
jgi:hypothetical protein